MDHNKKKFSLSTVGAPHAPEIRDTLKWPKNHPGSYMEREISGTWEQLTEVWKTRLMPKVAYFLNYILQAIQSLNHNTAGKVAGLLSILQNYIWA